MMTTKYILSALCVVATLLHCADAEATLVMEEMPDDELTLLQSQVEVKKGAAKANLAALEEEEEVDSSYGSAASCSSSESCARGKSATSFKMPQEDGANAAFDAEFLEEATQTSSSSSSKPKETAASSMLLSTVLQGLACLLIIDVVRRQAWSPTSSEEASLSAKPAATIFTVALAGDAAAFEKLIGNFRGQLSQADGWGCSVLHYAAKGGCVAIIDRLIEREASINAFDACDETALHVAARAGHVAACDTLIQAGAFIDSTNAEDCTPLVVAGRAEQDAVCRLLLANGAGVAGLAQEEVPQLVAEMMKHQTPVTD